MARDQVAAAIDNRTECVDDDEGRDLHPIDLAKRRALAGMGAAAEKVSLHRHASRALRPEREDPWAQRLERRLGEALVRIDLVQPPLAEVVDHRPGRARVVVPGAAADALVQEACRNGGDSLLAVDPAAGEDDRVPTRLGIAEAERVGIDRSRRAPAGIDDDRGAEHEADDGEPGRPFLIGADPDFDVLPVERKYRSMDVGVGDEPVLCALGGLSDERRGRRRGQPNASNQHARSLQWPLYPPTSGRVQRVRTVAATGIAPILTPTSDGVTL